MDPVRFGSERFPQAFVGYADLASPALEATLDALMKHRGLRGIRQQLHWHENAAYRFASRPDLMNDGSWRRGLREVAKRKLLFELQIFASQMTDGARLARDFPDLEFVLLHAGSVGRHQRGRLVDLAGRDEIAVGLPECQRQAVGPRHILASLRCRAVVAGDRGDAGLVRTAALPVRQQFPDREVVDRLSIDRLGGERGDFRVERRRTRRGVLRQCHKALSSLGLSVAPCSDNLTSLSVQNTVAADKQEALAQAASGRTRNEASQSWEEASLTGGGHGEIRDKQRRITRRRTDAARHAAQSRRGGNWCRRSSASGAAGHGAGQAADQDQPLDLRKSAAAPLAAQAHQALHGAEPERHRRLPVVPVRRSRQEDQRRLCHRHGAGRLRQPGLVHADMARQEPAGAD